MFKKITILIMTVAIMVTTYFLPASALAEKKEKSSTTEALKKLTVSDLESQFEIIDSTFKGSIRTVTYKKGSEVHIVVFKQVINLQNLKKVINMQVLLLDIPKSRRMLLTLQVN